MNQKHFWFGCAAAGVLKQTTEPHRFPHFTYRTIQYYAHFFSVTQARYFFSLWFLLNCHISRPVLCIALFSGDYYCIKIESLHHLKFVLSNYTLAQFIPNPTAEMDKAVSSLEDSSSLLS